MPAIAFLSTEKFAFMKTKFFILGRKKVDFLYVAVISDKTKHICCIKSIFYIFFHFLPKNGLHIWILFVFQQNNAQFKTLYVYRAV